MKYEKIQKILLNIEKTTPFQDDADMKRAVEKIRSREMNKKFMKADTDLISECTDTLLMLNGYDINKIDDDAGERSEKCLKRVYDAAENKNASYPVRVMNPKLKPVIILLIIIFCIFSTDIIAYACGFDAFSYIKKYGRELLNLQSGESINKYGITFTYRGDVKEYASLDDLIAKEMPDML
jgi:hypothetical protein